MKRIKVYVNRRGVWNIDVYTFDLMEAAAYAVKVCREPYVEAAIVTEHDEMIVSYTAEEVA